MPLLLLKSLPFNGDFPCLLFPLPFPCHLPFPRFSISLLHHGTSFIQLVGPYLHITTWFIMRGNVKFFRPLLWALRKSCQPFWFVPSPLGMGLAILYIKATMVSICVGSAQKILPITICSLWNKSICLSVSQSVRARGGASTGREVNYM